MPDQSHVNTKKQQRPPKWKRIDTAPRNGTRITLWDGKQACCAYWHLNSWHRMPIYEGMPHLRVENPTHWIE